MNRCLACGLVSVRASVESRCRGWMYIVHRCSSCDSQRREAIPLLEELERPTLWDRILDFLLGARGL